MATATRVPKDLGRLSDQELMRLWTKVGEEAGERKAAAKSLAAESERRQLAAQARDRLASMSDAERQALAQVAQAEGIESQEEVRGG